MPSNSSSSGVGLHSSPIAINFGKEKKKMKECINGLDCLKIYSSLFFRLQDNFSIAYKEDDLA